MAVIQSIEEGRKEDGNRSIADKIIKRLHDLDKTVENNKGRWAWELLQNAKDSIAEDDDRTVSVRIELLDNSVRFSHNGAHFTEQDIRGLINQISSKEVEEGEQTRKTGKFGTGFLTTHMLSRVIQVEGIVETVDGSYFQFQFPLDRDGKTTAQLVPKIEKAWSEFHNSAKKINTFNNTGFNTSFSYHLETEEQKRIASIGIDEFSDLVPFVLAFIPKISSIEISNYIEESNTVFTCNHHLIDNIIIPVSRAADGIEEDIFILFASNDRVAIATEAKKTDIGYSIKSIKNIPKLFCDFPLIGTESFYFPVIVNSFFFNPQTERDGIWLKGSDDLEVKENQELLEAATGLYKELVKKITELNFFNLFNIVETRMPLTSDKYFDDQWYRKSILEPLKEFVFNSKIVESDLEDTEKKSPKELWFPLKSYSDEIREKMWQFTFDQFPNSVCKKDHLNYWCNHSWDSWNKLNYKELITDLSKYSNIEKLADALMRDEVATFEWLNAFCKFILEDETNNILFEKNAVIPNQNGIFKIKTSLHIDKINDKELVIILELLEDDWKDILLHPKIAFGRYSTKDKKNIADRITEKLKTISYKHEDLTEAINLLSEWFESNPEEGKELFTELYRKRAELFMNTIQDKESLYKVMRTTKDLSKLVEIAKAIEDNPEVFENFENANELANLMNQFKLNNVADLKEMLLKAQNYTDSISKIEITQETLIGLGVTSIKELEEALKDKNIAAQFFHTSTPRVELFHYVKSLIARAKENIIEHLETLDEYDCSEMEELAETVIGGIKKEGLYIHVVIRPSDGREVIVYYTSEKDSLDYENAELWIDNGKDKPQHLTLGRVLKIIGVNRIPV